MDKQNQIDTVTPHEIIASNSCRCGCCRNRIAPKSPAIRVARDHDGESMVVYCQERCAYAEWGIFIADKPAVDAGIREVA